MADGKPAERGKERMGKKGIKREKEGEKYTREEIKQETQSKIRFLQTKSKSGEP